MNRFPRRKRLRLNEYDYSRTGIYFITMCVEKREPILSRIRVGGGVPDAPHVELTEYGEIVAHRIHEINQIYLDTQIEKFVIMPTHVHMIVSIRNVNDGPSGTPAPTSQRLPLLVSALKRFTNKSAGFSLWQRGYYEHILRDGDEYQLMSEYIDDNPKKWAQDRYYNEPGVL